MNGNIKDRQGSKGYDAFMRGDRGAYELYFKRPRKLRVETKYRLSSETRILNGDAGYREWTAPLFRKPNETAFLLWLYGSGLRVDFPVRGVLRLQEGRRHCVPLQDYYAGGMKIAEAAMKTYNINPSMPDSLFTP